MPVYTGIWAAVIWVPSPSRLALKERFDGTVDGPVTPHIRPSRYGRNGPYHGHNRPYHSRMMGMLTLGVSTVTVTFCSAPSLYVPLTLQYHILHLQGLARGHPSQGHILPMSQGIPSSMFSRGEYPQVSFSDRSLGLPPSVGPTLLVPLARSHSFQLNTRSPSRCGASALCTRPHHVVAFQPPPFSTRPQHLRCCNGGFISPASRLDASRASAMASAVPTTSSTPLRPAACISMHKGLISLLSMSTFTMCHQAQQGQHIQETQVCWPLLTTLPIL